MQRMAWCAAALGALALAAPGRADDAAPEHTGIKIGAKAPDFTLTDQAGKRRYRWASSSRTARWRWSSSARRTGDLTAKSSWFNCKRTRRRSRLLDSKL